MPRRRRVNNTRQRGGAAYDGSPLLKPTDSAYRILDHILTLHPNSHLTIPALVREILGTSEASDSGMEVECAIRDNVSGGTLCLKAGVLWPTRLAFDIMGELPVKINPATQYKATELRLGSRRTGVRPA